MKYRYLLYIVFLTLSTLTWLSCDTDNNAFKDKVEAQKNKKMFPFSETKKIEIFSYKSKDETDNSFSLLLRDHLNNPEQLSEVLKTNKLNIKERIVLQQNQIQDLSKLLYENKCPDEILGNCSSARHAILFYDKNDMPIAILEVSLDCMTVTYSKNFTKFSICEQKINEIKKFFQEAGITYFEEPIL